MFDKVIDLAGRFGVFDKIHHALVSQPGEAASKLAEILDEMQKTVEVLDAEMVRYLSLHFYSEESIAPGRVVLLGMEVGQSIIRINAARGHCHKIKNIYKTYLNKLFDKVFKGDPATRNQLARLPSKDSDQLMTTSSMPCRKYQIGLRLRRSRRSTWSISIT